MAGPMVTIDGNEAAACVAYHTSEVIAIYPITPASPMGELADEWARERRGESLGCRAVRSRDAERRLARPEPSTGRFRQARLATTFTASQGLLLMIPDMFKIAGELTPDGHSRRCPHRRHACAVDLRRPQRRHGVSRDRVCPAGVQFGPGGHGHGAHCARGDACNRACPSCTSSTASGHHTRCRRSSSSPLDDMRAMIDDELVAAHRARALSPDRPVHPRNGAEPGRLLPGARSRQLRIYLACPSIVQADNGQVRRHRRPRVSSVRLRGRARRGARHRDDGLGRRGGRRDRGIPGCAVAKRSGS